MAENKALCSWLHWLANTNLIHMWDFKALSYSYSLSSSSVLITECLQRIGLVLLIILKARRSAFDGLNLLRLSCSWGNIFRVPRQCTERTHLPASSFSYRATFKTEGLTLMRSSEFTYHSMPTYNNQLHITLMMIHFQDKFWVTHLQTTTDMFLSLYSWNWEPQYSLCSNTVSRSTRPR